MDKPKVLLIHNATLDGSQDEWRVSKLTPDGKTFVPVAGPFATKDDAMVAYRKARRDNEV